MRRIFFVLFLFLIPIVSVHAVANLPLGFEDQISITVNPEKPGPNTDVTVRVDSYSSNINKAQIEWSVNGKLILKETGANVFTTRTGALGSRTVISVIIRKEEGGSIEKSFVFEPAKVNLIMEPQTYVPPFYKGKSKLSHQSSYKVVAYPEFTDINGALIPAENLVYLWRKDFKVLQNMSGYGKRSIELTGDLLSQEFRIDVEVTALNSDVIAQKSITVDPIEPKTVFYQDHPLYGFLFNKSLLGTIPLLGKEINIAAFPFYYSTIYREEIGMTYEWKLNGVTQTERENKANMILRNEKNEAGEAKIDLRTMQSTTYLQYSDILFRLKFDAE